MSEPVRCALGFTVHTGWAAAVIAAGGVRAPRLLARERVELLGNPDRFVYHRAAEMPLAEAERTVARARSTATCNAAAVLAQLIALAGTQDTEVAACAVVANRVALPGTVAEIVAAHPRMHTAEGALYRDALAAAAESSGLRVLLLSPREAEGSQTSATAESVGKLVGRPWGKDQRLAAFAAWAALREGS